MVKPFISAQEVRRALNNLLPRATSDEVNCLYELTLVTEYLHNPDLPSIENARIHALNAVLIELITTGLTNSRYVLRLPKPETTTSIQEELPHIQNDGRILADHLINWSYLYYRYVRVDLNLSPEDYAKLIQIDSRTLRRYQTRAIKVLTTKIAIEEENARKRFRKRRLYKVLPVPHPIRLFGRDHVLNEAMQFLAENNPKHLFISGATGIGKTTLAQELARLHIESEPAIDHLIWIKSPHTIDQLCHQIEDALFIDDLVNQDLRDYLLRYRVMIVIDDVPHLSLDDLDSVLIYLSPAIVIITHHSYLPLGVAIKHIVLKELTQAEVKEYLRISSPNSVNDTEMIYKNVGGNPFAAKLLADQLTHTSALDLDTINLNKLYQVKFDRLSPDLQRAWVSFIFVSERGIPAESISRIWKHISSGHLRQLLNHHIIEQTTNKNLAISSFAGQFIKDVFETHNVIRQLIDEQFEPLVEAGFNLDDDVLGCIEHTLYEGLFNLSPDVERNWFEIMLDRVERRSARWLHILERKYNQIGTLEFSLLLEYGRLLRQFRCWERSQIVLEQALFEAGHDGRFVQQASAMLELAILFWIRGAKDYAYTLLDEAGRIATRYKVEHLLQRITLEVVQIAIDSESGAQAQALLSGLPLETNRSLTLFAEMCLLIGDHENGLLAAHEVLNRYVGDRLNTGITCVLLGRLYNKQQNYEEAHRYLTAGVTILETENHLLALGRAWMNLAVVLIHKRLFQPAKALLRRAEKLQEDIGDAVGLTITRYNLDLLNRDL